MTDLQIQTGFWKWFVAFPYELRSFTSIENRCINLWSQFFDDENTSLAKYRYFYPLFRNGVVEFYGKDRYGLSPSCLLYNSRNALWINPDAHMIDQVNLEMKTPGCYLKKFKVDYVSLCRSRNIPVNNFNLYELLKIIPSFDKVIKNWHRMKTIDSSKMMYFSDHWIPCNFGVKKGVYQSSVATFSQRIYCFGYDNSHLIPNRSENPDAWNIAVFNSRIQNLIRPNMSFNKALSKLTIAEPYFPIILERLLYFNTILNPKDEIDLSKREYFIENRDFNLLNRIANQLITIL